MNQVTFLGMLELRLNKIENLTMSMKKTSLKKQPKKEIKFPIQNSPTFFILVLLNNNIVM